MQCCKEQDCIGKKGPRSIVGLSESRGSEIAYRLEGRVKDGSSPRVISSLSYQREGYEYAAYGDDSEVKSAYRILKRLERPFGNDGVYHSEMHS